jgi:hypothetical protein
MSDHPRITLKYLFEEVMLHHLDQAIPRSIAEYMEDPELQDTITKIIQDSKEASQATLAISVRSRIPPPAVATCLQMGLIMGIGIALELLNEKEGNFDEDGPSPGDVTIQ